MNLLAGRRALVTGGASGIGFAIAQALAGAGAHVIVNDIHEESAARAARELRDTGASASHVQGSVADPRDVKAMFERIDRDGGHADILVNNAGISGNAPTLDLSDEDWLRVVSINQNGVFFCSREAGRRMREHGGGAIVNIGSIYSTVAAPNRLSYCATKAAVAMMTKSLALEWAEIGIRVNCVAPGYVDSALTRDLAAHGKLDLAALTRRIPQRRLGLAAEMADAVLYLCEPRSAYITGHVLTVDGGWTANGYL